MLSCCSKRNVILLEFLIASKIQKLDNPNQSCSVRIESTLLQHTYSCSVKLVKKSKVVLRWVDPRVQSCRRQQHRLVSSAPSPPCLIIVHQVHGAYPTSYKQEMNRNANKSLNHSTKWQMCIEFNFCCFWTTPSRASKALKKCKDIQSSFAESHFVAESAAWEGDVNGAKRNQHHLAVRALAPVKGDKYLGVTLPYNTTMQC